MSFAALGLIGAGLSAAGSVAGGFAQANTAAYQAKIAQNNATIARQNADHAAEAGEQQAADTSQKGAANLAAIKAGIAANGLDVNSGSAKDVETSARATSQLNTLRTENNAQDQVYGYRAQASGDDAQANLDKSEETPDIIGAGVGATGTLFGNASAIGTKNFGAGSGLSNLFA